MSKRSDKEEVRVSLLPTEKKRPGQVSRASTAVLWGVLIGVFVLIFGATVYFWARANRLEAVLKMESDKRGSLAAQVEELELRAGEIGNVAQRIGLAKSLLDRHSAMERMLELLEETTVAEASLTQFAADGEGGVVLAVKAASYDAAIRQILNWHAHPAIIGAQVSGISSTASKEGPAGVTFNATLRIKPDALRFAP